MGLHFSFLNASVMIYFVRIIKHTVMQKKKWGDYFFSFYLILPTINFCTV